MEKQLIKPEEFGLEQTKATELMGNLPQIKAERQILECQYEEIIKLDIDDPVTVKKARELRLLVQKNRTQGINVWHKNAKNFFLKGGQFVDAIKKIEISVNENMEDVLESIEKNAERKEAERIEEIKQQRLLIIEAYSEFIPLGINLGEIKENEFVKLLNGAKLQFETKKEAERLEAERVEKERLAEIERQKAIEEENLRLKKEAEEKETQLKKERAEAEAKLKAIQDEADKKAREEKAKQDAILKAEQEAKSKIEAELKAKKEQEDKAEKERAELEAKAKKEAEKLAKAPIKEQLSAWVDSFDLPKTDLQNETASDIINKFNSFKIWAKKSIDNL